MHTIWKYQVPVADGFALTMPAGAKVMDVQFQDRVGPCMWALVDPETEREERRTFAVYGTGHPIKSPEKLTYIGTFQECGGRLVWHLFEVIQ